MLEYSLYPGVGFILAWKHLWVIGSVPSRCGLRIFVLSVTAGAGAVRSHHLWMNQYERLTWYKFIAYKRIEGVLVLGT